MRKLITLLLLTPTLVWSQAIVSTAGGGPWDQTSTWVGGVVPISTNSSSISIVGPVNISSTVYNSATPLVIDQITINIGGALTIDAAAQVNVANGPGIDLSILGTGLLKINGTLVQLSGTTFAGTTMSNTSFNAGSTYEHRNISYGVLLTATWDASSTVLVNGLNGSSTAGTSWLQSIGNFIFDCPNLAAGVSNLGGNLRNIAGNFNVVRTGTTGRLMFSNAAGVVPVSIGGSLFVGDGTQNAALWITSTGTVTVTVGVDVILATTSPTPSQNATTGTGIIQLSGDFLLQSGVWNFLSGAGVGTISLSAGNFLANPGALVNRTGAGNATISFSGASLNQGIELDPSQIISGAINLNLAKSSGNLNLQTPLTIGAYTQSDGNLLLNGLTLTINGVISQTGGNIDASSTGSFVVGGTGAISSGLVFSPSPSLFNVFTLNRSAATFNTASDFRITTLNLTAGTLTNNGTTTIEDTGNINVVAGVLTNTPIAAGVYDVNYANTTALNSSNELPTAPSSALRNLSKTAAGALTLTKNIQVNGNLTLSGGSFAIGTNSISLVGNFISNATFTSLIGSTFTFTGGSATLTGSTAPTFQALVVNGTFTPSLGYRVNGNYTVGGGATVNAGSGTVTFGGTTLVTNGGVMNLNNVVFAAAVNTMTAPVTTMGIAGNFTSNGVFNNGGGTILFNGTTNLSAIETYNNITVSGTVTSTGNFGQTVGGNVINNGSFSLGTGNLTWSGSGTLSGSGNTTVADVIVSGTSFTYTSTGSLTLNDDVLGVGSFDSSSPTAGTVIFAGAGSAIAAGGIRTFRNISVTGTLTPTTTYTLTGVGGLAVSGTLVSGGTIVFGGTTQTITGAGSITFNVVTTNTSSNLSITPSITINDNLIGNGNISAAGTITFVGLTMTGTGTKNFTNVTVGAGTLTPNASYSIAGNLVVNGTLAAGNSTTTFNGTTTISGIGGTTFNFLTISGILTSSTGTINVVRDFTNNGTFNHNNGTVNLSTAGTNQIQLLGTNSIVFNNLIVNNVGVATDVINNINAGQTVDIAGALSFGEATAVIDADGAGSSIVRFLSTGDSPASDGRVAPITFAGSSISGNITVRRFVSSENRIYRYIASPVVGATVAQLQAVLPVTGTFTDPSNGSSSPPCTGCISTNPSLFSYNEATNVYVAFPAAGLASASSFANGRGYSAFFRHSGLGAVGQITINFRGTNPSSAGVVLPVSPSLNGYSLVGNPYPSPISWNNGAGWAKTGISDVIVVRDNATGVHQSYSAAAGTSIIAPGQSFWVQSTIAGATLSINENAKTSGNYSFFRMETPTENQVELLLTKQTTGVTDNARIVVVTNSSQSYDNFDGFKFDNSKDDGTTVTQVQDISTLSADSKVLGVNSIPNITCGQVFNVRVTNFVNSGETVVNYSLTINPTGSFKAISWVLRDNYLSTDIAVTNSTYNFVVDNSIAASKALNRFTLTALSAAAVDNSKSVVSAPTACLGSDAAITVASQPGFSYGLEVNGTLYANQAEGTGSDISMFVDAGLLVDGTNSIRVKASSGCDEQFLTTTVIVNQVAPAQIASVSTGALCSPGSVTLTASSLASNVTYNWYDKLDSSVPIATGVDFITPILSDSTNYFVAVVSPNGCEGNRVPVKVAFGNIALSLSASASAVVCEGEGVTLSASSNLVGGSFKWYDSPAGSSSLATGSDLNVASLQSSKSFYVTYLSAAGCESDRVEVKAEVLLYNPILEAQKLSLSTCAGNSQLFKATGGGDQSNYRWFDGLNSTQPLFEGIQFETSAIFSDKTYYLESTSVAGCTSKRAPVVASVIAIPSAPVFAISQDQICNSGETNVRITNANSAINYRWYSSMLSTQPIYDGVSFTSEALSSQTSYFVSGVNSSGCESTERSEVVLQVTQFVPPLINANDPSRLSSNYPANNQWYLDNQELKNETGQFLVPTASGVYDLKINVNGCFDWAGSVFITTIITGVEDDSKEFYVYPNPSSDVLRIIIHDQQPMKASLFDSKGSFVSHINLTGISKGWEGHLDVNNLPKGLYLLQLSSGDKKLVHKVIIN